MERRDSQVNPYAEVGRTLTVAANVTKDLLKPVVESLVKAAIIYADSKFQGKKTYHMLRPLIEELRT